MDEQLDILRRIAERGLKQAQNRYWPQLGEADCWQHMLDEIERTKVAYGKERERVGGGTPPVLVCEDAGRILREVCLPGPPWRAGSPDHLARRLDAIGRDETPYGRCNLTITEA